MNPIDIVIIAVVVLILGLAGWYIYRSKKAGRKCIGCPDNAQCSGDCASCQGNQE